MCKFCVKYFFICTLTVANVEVWEDDVVVGRCNVTGICANDSFAQRCLLLHELTFL